MSIQVERHLNGYSAVVTRPEGRQELWTSGPPMKLRKLIDLMKEQGCHQTDITDVLYEVNPNWLGDLDS